MVETEYLRVDEMRQILARGRCSEVIGRERRAAIRVSDQVDGVVEAFHRDELHEGRITLRGQELRTPQTQLRDRCFSFMADDPKPRVDFPKRLQLLIDLFRTASLALFRSRTCTNPTNLVKHSLQTNTTSFSANSSHPYRPVFRRNIPHGAVNGGSVGVTRRSGMVGSGGRKLSGFWYQHMGTRRHLLHTRTF